MRKTNDRTCYRCGEEFCSWGLERVCQRCRKGRQPPPTRPGTPLSFREKQVIALVADSKQNKEIAWALKLTEGTVKEYMNRIFTKLGMTNRTQLAVWHVRSQLELRDHDAHLVRVNKRADVVVEDVDAERGGRGTKVRGAAHVHEDTKRSRVVRSHRDRKVGLVRR